MRLTWGGAPSQEKKDKKEGEWRPVIRAEPHPCCSSGSGWGGVIPSAANLLFPRQPSCTHTHLLAQRADWQEEPCSSLSEKVQRHRFINTNSPCSEFQVGWVLTGVYLGELVLPSRQMRKQRSACSPGLAFSRLPTFPPLALSFPICKMGTMKEPSLPCRGTRCARCLAQCPERTKHPVNVSGCFFPSLAPDRILGELLSLCFLT